MAFPAKEVSDKKRLVLDANILLRAVLGVRVRTLLETYEDSARFFTPDICFEDAENIWASFQPLATLMSKPAVAFSRP
jgi:PIN domain-containing protein